MKSFLTMVVSVVIYRERCMDMSIFRCVRYRKCMFISSLAANRFFKNVSNKLASNMVLPSKVCVFFPFGVAASDVDSENSTSST